MAYQLHSDENKKKFCFSAFKLGSINWGIESTLTKLEIGSDELDSDIRLFFPSRRMYDKLVWFGRLI